MIRAHGKAIIFSLVVLLLFSGQGSAQATYTICQSGCNATNFTEAMGFVADGDVINVQSDLLIENMNTIDKAIIIEFNNHIINASLPMYGTAIKLTKPSVVNNFTLVMTNYLGAALLAENMNNVAWKNINISAIEKIIPYARSGGVTDYYSNFYCCKMVPNSAGITVSNSDNFTLINYTTQDTVTALWFRETKNSTARKLNITGTHMEKPNSWGAISIDQNSENITIDDYDVSGYDRAVRVGSYGQGSTVVTKNITLRNGRTQKNNYGVTGGTYNLTIIDSTFDSAVLDILAWGDENYRFLNITVNSLVSIPGQILNVTKYSGNVTVNGSNYQILGGYGISADITGSLPYTLELGYNKTLVQQLNINPSTLKIYHEINATSNETLTPTEINADRGTVKVQVNSLSPFYVISDPTPAPIPTPVPVSGGGGGGGNGGGGGGGSGGASGENYTNIELSEKYEKWWQAGIPVAYDFSTLSNIQSVTIVPNESIGLVEVRVEELKNTSSLVNGSAGDDVKYFNVWVGTNGTSKHVKSAQIRFRVPFADAVVKNYDSGEWTVLKTVRKSEDSNFSYFEVEPGTFGNFAIIKEDNKDPAPMTDSQPQAVPPPTKTKAAQDTPPQPAPGFEALIAVAGLLVCLRFLKRR